MFILEINVRLCNVNYNLYYCLETGRIHFTFPSFPEHAEETICKLYYMYYAFHRSESPTVFTHQLSPKTPGWTTGHSDLFKTPSTLSPVKRRSTRR